VTIREIFMHQESAPSVRTTDVDRESAPLRALWDRVRPRSGTAVLRAGRRRLPRAEEVPDTNADDPVVLLEALEASDRFRRDSRLGAIFHPGTISFRELTRTDSLHITIAGSRVSAHVDEISPFNFGSDGSAHYCWTRVMAHNLSGLKSDLVRRARGLNGQQRCNLECEAVWVDDEPDVDDADACHDHPAATAGGLDELRKGGSGGPQARS
jgi:hypothetical protein